MPEMQLPFVTVVVASPPAENPAQEALAEGLVHELRCRSTLSLVRTPHLYHLTVNHPAVGHLRRIEGALAVAAFLKPRAAKWVLHTLGVGVSGRLGPVRCLDLAEFSDAASTAAERISQELCAAGAPFPEASRPDAPPVADFRGEKVAARWYPVVDRERCRGCLECLNFCLFGVFEASAEGVEVVEPDSCKMGCPACARLCPQGAIMFPDYQESVAIAGGAGSIPAEAEPISPLAERQRFLDRLLEELDAEDD